MAYVNALFHSSFRGVEVRELNFEVCVSVREFYDLVKLQSMVSSLQVSQYFISRSLSIVSLDSADKEGSLVHEIFGRDG